LPLAFNAFSMLVRDASDRRELAEAARKDIGRVFILAVVMDGIYQYVGARWIHPSEAASPRPSLRSLEMSEDVAERVS
jgi:hypothetical protein